MHLSDRIALQIGSSNRIIKDIPKGVQTALLDNAGVISKQASKYSTVRKAIVLCDYRKSRTIMFWNVIVLDFRPWRGEKKIMMTKRRKLPCQVLFLFRVWQTAIWQPADSQVAPDRSILSVA